MNPVIDLLKSHRSIRKFTDQQVDVVLLAAAQHDQRLGDRVLDLDLGQPQLLAGSGEDQPPGAPHEQRGVVLLLHAANRLRDCRLRHVQLLRRGCERTALC